MTFQCVYQSQLHKTFSLFALFYFLDRKLYMVEMLVYLKQYSQIIYILKILILYLIEDKERFVLLTLFVHFVQPSMKTDSYLSILSSVMMIVVTKLYDKNVFNFFIKVIIGIYYYIPFQISIFIIVLYY